MSSTVIIIGEILAGIIQILSARAIASGAKAEEVNQMIDEAVAKAKQNDPNNLPDV